MSKIDLITICYIYWVIRSKLSAMGKLGPKTPNLVNDRRKAEKAQKTNQSGQLSLSIKLTDLGFNWYLIVYQ
jgi:hypothetical protein